MILFDILVSKPFQTLTILQFSNQYLKKKKLSSKIICLKIYSFLTFSCDDVEPQESKLKTLNIGIHTYSIFSLCI